MCDEVIELTSSSNSPPSSPGPLKCKLEGIPEDIIPSSKMRAGAVHDLSESDTDNEAANDGADQIDFSILSRHDNEFDMACDYKNEIEDIDMDIDSQPLMTQDIQDDVLSQASKADKEALKEAKRKLKERKQLEKKERLEAAEKLRALKPGECMKYILAHIDLSLGESNIGRKACELLSQTELKFRLASNDEPDSVRWTRSEGGDGGNSSEKHLLFVWSYDRTFTAVKYRNLLDTFNEIKKKYPGYRLHLGIYGLKEYFRKCHTAMQRTFKAQVEPNAKKKKKSTDHIVSRHELEMALVELEVTAGVSSRKLNTPDDLALLIYQFSKSIAETPYKLQIEKKDNERNWFARGDSRDCVRIDKDYNGLLRLWQQQLCQFHHSSLDVARSITEHYPTPLSLYKAYMKLSSQQEREALLQDLPVMRNTGPSSSNRRIGPDLSRKIALMFSQKKGDIMLSQE